MQLKHYKLIFFYSLTMLLSPEARSASWFNLGNWYGASSGMLTWEVQSTVLPNGIATSQTSSLNFAYQNQYQIHGFLWRPWISNFSIGTLLEYNASNIHDFNQSTHNFMPNIGTTVNLFPFSNFRGTISANFNPLFSYNKDDDWSELGRTSVNYKQSYNSIDNIKKYELDYNWFRQGDNENSITYLTSASITGQQYYLKHSVREFSHWASQYNNTTTDQIEAGTIGIQHSYTPEFSGLIINNLAGISKTSSADQNFDKSPFRLNLSGDIGYKYDEEYVDKSKVPAIGFNYTLSAIEGSQDPDSGYAGLKANWPNTNLTSMNSNMSYSYAQKNQIYRVNHSVSAIIPQIVRNNVNYTRNLSSSINWVGEQYSQATDVRVSAGHSATITTELKNTTAATYFVSQNINQGYQIEDHSYNTRLSHAIGFNTNNERHQSGVNLVDSRANNATDSIPSSSQILQASLKTLLKKTSDIDSSLNFNFNWNQNVDQNDTSSYTSAQIQYSYSNTMVFEVRNLKSQQTLTLDIKDTDRQITYDTGISYFIGSTIVKSGLTASYLENYNIAVKLELTRLF